MVENGAAAQSVGSVGERPQNDENTRSHDHRRVSAKRVDGRQRSTQVDQRDHTNGHQTTMPSSRTKKRSDRPAAYPASRPVSTCSSSAQKRRLSTSSSRSKSNQTHVYHVQLFNNLLVTYVLLLFLVHTKRPEYWTRQLGMPSPARQGSRANARDSSRRAKTCQN